MSSIPLPDDLLTEAQIQAQDPDEFKGRQFMGSDTFAFWRSLDPGGGYAWTQVAGSGGGGASEGVTVVAGARVGSTISLTIQVTDGDGPGAGSVAGVRDVLIDLRADGATMSSPLNNAMLMIVNGAGTQGLRQHEMDPASGTIGYIRSAMEAATNAAGLLEVDITTNPSGIRAVTGYVYLMPPIGSPEGSQSGSPKVARFRFSTNTND